MASSAAPGVPYEEQIEALEMRITTSRDAAANLTDAYGGRVGTLDQVVQSMSAAYTHTAGPGAQEAFANLNRVADLTLLQLTLCTKQNDALKKLVDQKGGGSTGDPELVERLSKTLSLANNRIAMLSDSERALSEATERIRQREQAETRGGVKELLDENKRAREMVERLQRSVAERDVQIGELETSLKAAEGEAGRSRQQHQDKLRELQGQVETLRQVASSAASSGQATEGLRQQVRDLEKRRDAQQQALAQASEALEASRMEIRQLQQSGGGWGGGGDAVLRHENEVLKRRLDALSAGGGGGGGRSPEGPQGGGAGGGDSPSKDEMSRLRHELAGASQQRDAAQKECEALKGRLEAQGGEVARMQRALTEAGERARLADGVREEADGLKLQLTSVQGVLKTHSTNLTQTKGERDQAIAESARLVEQVGQARGLLEERSLALEKAERELSEGRSAQEHMKSVIAQMRAELASAKGANTALCDSQRALEEDVEGMQARVKELSKEAADKGEEARECQKYIISLTEKLNEMVEDESRKAEVEGHTNSVIAKLRSKNEQLNATISQLEGERDTALKESADSMQMGTEAEATVKRLTERLQDYADKARKRDEEEREQRARVADLEDSEVAYQRRVQDLQGKVESLEGALSAREASLALREEELRSLQAARAAASAPRVGGGGAELELAEAEAAALRAEVEALKANLARGGGSDGSPARSPSQHKLAHVRDNAAIKELAAELHRERERVRELEASGRGGGGSPGSEEAGALRAKVAQLTAALAAKNRERSPGAGGEEGAPAERVAVLEEVVEQCKEVISQQEKEIEKQKQLVKAAREGSRQEVSVLTQHNITLSKALKAARDSEEVFTGSKGERAKLSEQLHSALQRGHEIQLEKDRALEVASKAVADLEAANVESERLRSEKVRLLARVRSAKMFAAYRIIKHGQTQTKEGAIARWVDVSERARTERLLVDAMGHDDSIEHLKWKERD